MDMHGRKYEINEFKRRLALEDIKMNPNLDSDLGLNRYVKNADKMKSFLISGKILDWGCGLGQMTYLLRNRGFEVISYDIDQGGRHFLAGIGQSLIVGKDQTKLPFSDSSFDAVLSSGVLEHVADQRRSIKEVSRILKRQGYLFVFRLPNKYSYIEFISDKMGRGDHPVKYSINDIRHILEQGGYDILYMSYQGFMPYNLKGFPEIFRNIYHRFDLLWEMFDALFSAIPIINLLCTNIELVARKK